MGGRLADGLYEHVVTGALARDLGELEQGQTATTELLEPADSNVVLARHLAAEVERALAMVPHADRPIAQVTIVNRLLDELRAIMTKGDEAADAGIAPAGSRVEAPGHELLSIFRAAKYERPQTPLASSTLLTRNRAEPNLGGELAREVASADRIDVLVAFITVGGVRLLRDALDTFARRSTTAVRLRVLTTVFTQTTELDAVELLAALPGAQVKVSYDIRRTRLHAKAWLFYRDTGLHTAYVGSANFTSTALGSGQEWMVKACAGDLPHVIEKFKGTFESLWNDSEFEPFDPQDEDSRSRLRAALAPTDSSSPQVFFSLRPFPFQEEILDRLATERSVHGRHRNLVVAATGTGKTVVAAFDYVRQIGPSQIPPRLLFLAHRKEILDQALQTFRQALHDGAFGQVLAAGDEPAHWDHVFATIQSAASRDLLGRFGPDHFQYVVVDECHHAPADSYRALIPHLRPAILLGLTATPERTDGKSLLPDFDGHIAAELRIWHALDQTLASLSSPTVKQELNELCSVLSDRIALPHDIFPAPDWPLALHRHYSRFEIAAAVGYKRPGDKSGVPQAGILKVSDQRELLFITLDKSAKSFSPTTRYRDYAISPALFHWETQSVASVHRESGRRYIESPGNGWRFYLFVRTDPDAPFPFCGPAIYQSHEGDRPIAITWRFEHALPAALYQQYATLIQG